MTDHTTANAAASNLATETMPVVDRARQVPWLSGAALVLSVIALVFSFQNLRANMGLQKLPAEGSGKASPGELEVSQNSSEKPTETAQKITPQPVSARVRLATKSVEMSLDQLRSEAEQVVKELEQRLPDQPASLHVAALFYAQTRQTAEAQRRWARCIELAPSVELYYINLAAVAMDRGENELALATLQRAQERGFSSNELLHNLGLALSNAGRSEEAIPILEKSLQQDPRDASAWLSLGKLQIDEGELDGAEVSLQKAVELGGPNSAAFFALGNVYARQGKKDKADEFLKLYREYLVDKSNSTSARLEALNANELRQTAVAVLIEAASVIMHGGDAFESERLLMRALALEPRSRAAATALAKLYYDKRMLREERIIRERLLELDPYQFSNYVDLAKVCAQLDDLPAAEAVLKVAMTMRPNAPDAFATLAEFHWQSRELPEARWYAEQAVKRQRRPEGYQLLAAICDAQRDDAGKREALEQAELLRRKGD